MPIENSLLYTFLCFYPPFRRREAEVEAKNVAFHSTPGSHLKKRNFLKRTVNSCLSAQSGTMPKEKKRMKRSRSIDDATDVQRSTPALSGPNTEQEARLMWLRGESRETMALVERWYTNRMSELKQLRLAKSSQACNTLLSDEEVSVREKLILLLLQSNRAKEAAKGLAQLGYVVRLSSAVLDYALADDKEVVEVLRDIGSAPEQPPAVAVDGALDTSTLASLQRALAPVDAAYWTFHQYSVEPPTPYFSYVLPVDTWKQPGALGPLGELMRRVLSVGRLVTGKAEALESVKYAEVWAHNRPHASGHQLHYDSDDEGRGGIRNPVVSSVCFLTGTVGGPTLVTNQRLGDAHLGSRGWLCHAKENRLLVFDGSVLHGVIPGKGPSPHPDVRRVTVMVALWEAIQIRSDENGSWGSARPWPSAAAPAKVPSWVVEMQGQSSTAQASLTKPNPNQLKSTSVEGRQNSSSSGDALLVPCASLWESVSGEAWPLRAPIPPYDAVFQGF